jgi:AcrR family transcriptional regulator
MGAKVKFYSDTKDYLPRKLHLQTDRFIFVATILKLMSKSDRTRQQIIEKAAALFNQRGFAGTSMGDIIKATGLSKGGVYGNFSSKEDIAVAAFQHAVDQVHQQVRARTRVIEHPIDKLKAVVYFYKEHAAQPPIAGGCPIQNTAIEADDGNLLLREHAIKAVGIWHDRIVTTLKNGQEKKQVHPDISPEDFATQFIATLEGGIMLAQLHKEDRYFNPVAQLLLQMIEQLQP